MLKNKTNVGLIIILIIFLICIRVFENSLFYDPFLSYFKGDYLTNRLPIYNPIKLFLSLGFRFYINSILSLILLYLLFRDSKIVKFAMLLYIVLGTILMISFFFTLKFFGEESKMTLFYIRRFIIQPLFLMVFIPAFYYQKKVN
jgi:exosortase F-associated protein